MISLIAAIGKGNNVLGKEGKLPWHLPADSQYFKDVTMGHPILMGRKTWESIGSKPLPGRLNVVITRNPDFKVEGGEVFHSLEEVLSRFRQEDVFVVGGGELYREALPFADRLYLTEVEGQFEGDAFFPEFKKEEWTETVREVHTSDEKNPYPYIFTVLERKK